MASQNDDAEMLYRRVVHLLQHGSRTATYKLATMTALVDFSTDHLPAGGESPLRVPISDLATRVIGLYWPQVRHFEGKFLKQSTGMHSRIIEAVVQLQAVAASGETVLPVDVIALQEPKAFRRAVDLVAITLAQQPLPRLQRMAGAAKSVPFLFDDSFLRDNVSRSELQKHDNSIVLKPGVAQGFKEAKRPLIRTLQSMWVDDILRMNRLSVDLRADIAHHLFGHDHLIRVAESTQAADRGEQDPQESARIIRDLPTPSPYATFAQRLDLLLEAVPPDHAAAYSLPRIAAKLQARGLKINASDLASLRLGFQDNASHRLKNALAEVFKIDPVYWSGKSLRVSYGATSRDDETGDYSEADIELGPADSEDDETSPAENVTDGAPFESVGRHRAKADHEHYDIDTPRTGGTQPPPMSTDISHFARRLNDLFEHHLAPDGHTYTNDEVASELQADALPITEGLIERLRTGAGALPTPQQVHALTYFFDIDEDFFTAGSHSYQVTKVVAQSDRGTDSSTSLPARSASENPPPADQPMAVAAMAARVVALSSEVCTHLEKVPVDIDRARSILLSIKTIGSELARSTGHEHSPNLDMEMHHDSAHSAGAAIDNPNKPGDAAEHASPQPSFDDWTAEEAGERGLPGRWTLRSFEEAVEHPHDSHFLHTLLLRFGCQTEILGDHPPFWYGERPRGGLFFYPFRLRYPPFQLLIDGEDRLTVRGNWRNFSTIAGHPGFAELAEMLGQLEYGPSSSVRVEGLDPEEFWDVALATAIAVNA